MQRVLRLISAGCELPYECGGEGFQREQLLEHARSATRARRFFRVYQQLAWVRSSSGRQWDWFKKKRFCAAMFGLISTPPEA